MRRNILLVLIVLLAAFLRFYQIDENPKALYGDSLTGVYDAYSILKTGHDQKGNFLPLVFSLGGGRPGGYIYATVPFVAIFGPTALASRMVSALSGIGIVILLYLLGRKLVSKGMGLATATIAAFNPWSLSLSRGPFESHFALFLTLLGFYAFILGLKNKWWFILFGLSFLLASQTYSTYRLTIPLFSGLLLFWIGKENLVNQIKKPLFLISLTIIAASAILSVYLTLSRGSQDRFDIINVFKDPNLRHSISQKVKNERILDSLPSQKAAKLHTPQIELTAVVAENYAGNFFPDFLFTHGDRSVRHNPAEMGEFFWIDALLLIIGIITLYKLNKKLLILLISWMLIAPVPTSLVGGPHALRSSFLLPPLLIFAGLGLWKLWIRKEKFKPVIFLILVFFSLQAIFFVDRFYFVAPQKQAGFWSYPAKRASLLALENLSQYDYIYLSNDIDNMEFAYPVYAKLDPSLVIQQNRSRSYVGEFPFFKYGNVYIGSLPNTRVNQFIKDLPGSVLYIGSGKEEQFIENNKILRGFDGQVDLVLTSKTSQ